jgi:hypothetical protein
MIGTSERPARGQGLLLAHVDALTSDAQPPEPPQLRLSECVGPGLAGLLVHALRGDHGAPRNSLRV